MPINMSRDTPKPLIFPIRYLIDGCWVHKNTVASICKILHIEGDGIDEDSVANV